MNKIQNFNLKTKERDKKRLYTKDEEIVFFLRILFFGVNVFVVMCKLPDEDKTQDTRLAMARDMGHWQTRRHCQWPDGMWGLAWAPITPHGWPHTDTI